MYLYAAEDASGRRWARQTVNAEMPAVACATGDLNGEGRVDTACIGSANGTLKWYENQGRGKER